jgi:predicted DNA-binding transcriptional regulator YafY
MSRAERLLSLMQLLRRHRYPAPGKALASEIGVSLRTLYRDIQALQNQGAPIDGEAGVGFLLRPGYTLPPLNFTEEEIEALVLGSRWVQRRTDARLGGAAREALVKIRAVLPPDRLAALELDSLSVVPAQDPIKETIDLGTVRQALRQERKLAIRYKGESGKTTQRVVWPVALGYLERWRVLAAWCELRNDFRHFRSDRITKITLLDQRLPRRRSELLKAWKATQDQIPQQ